ncbi:hypothetical protein [Frateuria soli]|uniref:hypothetical protein n=1 Tax=Frateuria soli TaxID=1542730 RepID=UPI001E3EA3E2|nr:hypothetical protein [Frateuria soli]UGB37844.1 hypothetical protein LQ771_13635 [Frateuria soli]
MTDATGAPALAGAPDRRSLMNGQAKDGELARRKGVRRTLWITGTIAVVLFLLSILSMVRIG